MGLASDIENEVVRMGKAAMTIYEFGHEVSGFRPMMLDGGSKDWDGWRELARPVAIGAGWRAPEVRYCRAKEFGAVDDAKNVRKDSDNPWVRGTVMQLLSERAAIALKGFRGGVELLPVVCGEGTYYVVHCLNQLVDAIDLEKSEGSRSSRDGRLLTAKKYVLRPEVVRGQDLFSMVAPDPYRLYVSERFVKAAGEAGLCGIDFLPIWSG